MRSRHAVVGKAANSTSEVKDIWRKRHHRLTDCAEQSGYLLALGGAVAGQAAARKSRRFARVGNHLRSTNARHLTLTAPHTEP